MSKGNIELNSFLKTINLMNSRYEFYKGRERKFIQIREYEKQVASLLKKMSKKRPLTFIDCGAGSCYLSFYLNYMNRNREIRFTCIDYNGKLMERAAATAKALGYTNMSFVSADILSYVPEERPDLVYSLHACDTATDMAVYTGLKSRSRHIATVSCCQRYTKNQLGRHPLASVTRNKVYKERLTDMIGDSMRALLLESYGYDTDLFEFASSRHTDKNVMLRATRIPASDRRKETAGIEYEALGKLFRMEPKLMDFIRRDTAESAASLAMVS